MKHLLSLEKLPVADIEKILRDAVVFKRERARRDRIPLSGQIWALLFSKSSTRTRVSFEVGIRELGGQTMFLSASEHSAWPRRADQGHRARARRHDSRRGHPHVCAARRGGVRGICENPDHQRADRRGASVPDSHGHFHVQGKARADFGQGRDVRRRRRLQRAASWIFAAAKLGFELRIAAPKKFQPSAEILKRAGGSISCTADVESRREGADLLYTTSGFRWARRRNPPSGWLLSGYQINQKLVKLAKPDALVMHCLPAYRGKEIDAETFEANADTIFTQAENRLHVQKAILNWAVGS
jgi:ornithine carbamoyltransferase